MSFGRANLDVLELQQVLEGDGILGRLLPLWDVVAESPINKVIPRRNYHRMSLLAAADTGHWSLNRNFLWKHWRRF